MTIQPSEAPNAPAGTIARVELIREPTALRVTRVLQAFTFASVRKGTVAHSNAARRVLEETPGLPSATSAALVERLWADYPTRSSVLAQVCASLPSGWAPAIAVELATSNPLLEPAELSTGSAQVRIDAIFDVLACERSCHDIQQEWVNVMKQLHESAQSDTERVAGKGSELLGGLLGKFSSTLMEVGVEQGLTMLNDLSATHTVIVDDLARLVVAVRAGIGELDTGLLSTIYQTLVQAEHLISRDVGEAKRRGNTSYEANRHLMLVKGTIQMIQDASGRSPADLGKNEMPDVMGMRLPDAVHLLRNVGIQSRYEAAPDSQGNTPSVRAPKNWVVTDQAPQAHQEADGVAVLTVKRFGNVPEFPRRR